MASIRRKTGSPYWFACFALPDGSGRTQRSTKFTDRVKALRLAQEWEKAAKDRITEGQARKVLSEIHELIHGSPIDSASVSEYFAQWIKRKTGETAAVTLTNYRLAGEDFLSHLGPKAALPMHYVTKAQIAAYRDSVAARTSARTANNKLKVVRLLFQSAWRDGIVPENPAAKVQALKSAESARRPFSLSELRSVLTVANEEWQGMILAGLYTGQRLKDVASLTWSNVDLERSEIRLLTSKTGRWQVIPIAKPLQAYFEQLPAVDDAKAPLFPNAHRIATGNQDTSALSQQFHDILVAAGMAQPRSKSKKRQEGSEGRQSRRPQNEVTFHSLRHTATSLLKNAGVSEAVARDIIGHDSSAISRHYTHVEESAKRAAIALLPDVLGG